MAANSKGNPLKSKLFHTHTAWHRLNMELDLQSLFVLLCETPQSPAPSLSRIWAHKLGRYSSAKIADIFL
jgi:hypothetical protein